MSNETTINEAKTLLQRFLVKHNQEALVAFEEFINSEGSANTVERNWEIVQVKNTETTFFRNKSEWAEGSWEETLKDPKMIITSVRRLSDNEVFSIGDEIYQNTGVNKECFAIDGFEIAWDKIYANARDLAIPFCLWEKAHKEVLFTTNDGVPIRDGDRFIAVQKNTSHVLICKNALDKPEIWDTFSNEEKAEEFIKYNRKDYSLNDIKEAFGEGAGEGAHWLIEQLLKNKP